MMAVKCDNVASSLELPPRRARAAFYWMLQSGIRFPTLLVFSQKNLHGKLIRRRFIRGYAISLKRISKNLRTALN